MIFSADETLDLGGDLALPVTDDYAVGEENAFQGTVNWVRIDLEDDDNSHLIPDDQVYKAIISRQ
jgi:arylsulfatase